MVRQVYESTRWIKFVLPFLLKVGAFGLGFSGSVAVILAGILIDELAEEMQRDAEGKPGRTPDEILGSIGTQFLIDRLFHGLFGGFGKGAAAAGIAPKLASKLEHAADRAVPLVRKELVEAEKPLVKEALEHGTARRLTDKAAVAEGHTLEVAVETAGERHVFRMNKDGTWCRLSSPICNLDLGADIAAAAKSPKSITTTRLADVRAQMTTIIDEISFLETTYQRMKAAGKMDLTLLSKEERALLDQLAEEGNAAKLSLAELRDMKGSPALTKTIDMAADEEKRLVAQLYREGRPLWEIMRAASPSSKARAAALAEFGRRDAVTGLAARSGVLEIDHVVPLNDIVRMPGFDKLRPERQLEIVNDVKNLRPVDRFANSSRGDRSWSNWPQALIHYDLAAINRMKALEGELRAYVEGRIARLSRP